MKIPEIDVAQINLRCGITLFASQDKAIDKVLNDLVEKIPAQLILLTDISGQIVSVCGERGKANLVAMGSLVAGDLAASQEMARISGEYQDYQLILREGSIRNTWIVEAGPYLVMLLQVSTEVPMGWVRLLIRKSAQVIAGIIATPPEEIGNDYGVTQNLELGDNFAEQVNDALDGLWSE